MVVYYTTTHYQVLCAIMHKLIYKSNDKSILLISDSRASHKHLCETIIKQDIFDNVVYFRDKNLVSMATSEYKLCKTNFNMKRIMKKMVKNVEQITPFEINNENEYYLMSDFRPFSLYLICNKINYNYFEDACGVLSRNYLLMNVLKSPWTIKVIKEYKLNGENDLVIKKYADIKAQEEGFIDEKMVDFSIKKLMKNISKEQKEKILSIFSLFKIDNTENSKALILTQPFIQRNKISIEEQKEIYSLLMDFFCEKMDIYIKPHPLDFISLYSKWFNKAKIIDANIPSELLTLGMTGKFERAISVSSTAIYSLDKYINNIILFDNDAEKEVINLYMYYAIGKILEKLELPKYDIKLIGINKKIILEIIKYQTNIKLEKINIGEYFDSDLDINAKKVYVVYKTEDLKFFDDKLNNDDIVILLDYKKILTQDFDFINRYKEAKIIKIKLKDLKNNYDKRIMEVLVYTKSKEKNKKLDKLKETKKLIHSRMMMKIDNYNFLSNEIKDDLIEILEKQNLELRRMIK